MSFVSLFDHYEKKAGTAEKPEKMMLAEKQHTSTDMW